MSPSSSSASSGDEYDDYDGATYDADYWGSTDEELDYYGSWDGEPDETNDDTIDETMDETPYTEIYVSDQYSRNDFIIMGVFIMAGLLVSSLLYLLFTTQSFWVTARPTPDCWRGPRTFAGMKI